MIIFFICFLLLSACNSKTISSDLPLATSPTTIPKKYLIKTTFVPQAPEKIGTSHGRMHVKKLLYLPYIISIKKLTPV